MKQFTNQVQAGGEGETERAEAAAAGAETVLIADGQKFVVPVIQEDLEVHKELRKTGTVRIRKTIRETGKLIEQQLVGDQVVIERVAIDRAIDRMPETRTEDGVMIVPVVEEVLIVTKELRLVEEIHIRKTQVTSTMRERVVLRSEDVTVERTHEETGLVEQL